MNNKTVLTMIEQVLAVLVFTIASAICIRVFAYSSTLSDDTDDISNACVMIQNATELIKNTSGDADKISKITGWALEDNTLTCTDNNITMTVSIGNTDEELLGKAEIVLTSNNKTIDTLEVYFQEPYPVSTPIPEELEVEDEQK